MPPDPLPEVAEALEDVADEVGDFLARLRDDLFGREGYLIVLVMTVLVVVAIPIDEEFRGGRVLTVLVLGLLVITTMSRSKVPRLLRVAAAVVTIAAFVIAVVLSVTDDTPEARQLVWLAGAFTLSYTLVLSLCFPAILRQAFSHRRISLNTMAAALAAYLLIGLIFTSIFRFVDIVAPPFFEQGDVSGFTFEYFSYVTLSTVGYGDYTPANDAGRTLAMLEAVFGQIFLVTIVALVVSNLGVERGRLRRTMVDPSGPAAVDEAGPSGVPPDP